ncbi:hypothetical protein KFE80_10580 [bacterium SCSIO 12696]|nr:hypothetical protein KFE80_10580 [bacterium SCSIO 12696]
MKTFVLLMLSAIAIHTFSDQVEPVENKYLSEAHKRQYGTFVLTRYWQNDDDNGNYGYRICSEKTDDCLDFPKFEFSLTTSVVTTNDEVFLVATPFYEVGLGDAENWNLSIYRWRDKQRFVTLQSSTAPNLGDYNGDGRIDFWLESGAEEACDWHFGYPRFYTLSQNGFEQVPLRQFPEALRQYVKRIRGEIEPLKTLSESEYRFAAEVIKCVEAMADKCERIAERQ